MSSQDTLLDRLYSYTTWVRGLIQDTPDLVNTPLEDIIPSICDPFEIAELNPQDQYKELTACYLQTLEELLRTIPKDAKYWNAYMEYCFAEGFQRCFRTVHLSSGPKRLEPYDDFQAKQIRRDDDILEVTPQSPSSEGSIETVDPDDWEDSLLAQIPPSPREEEEEEDPLDTQILEEGPAAESPQSKAVPNALAHPITDKDDIRRNEDLQRMDYVDGSILTPAEAKHWLATQNNPLHREEEFPDWTVTSHDAIAGPIRRDRTLARKTVFYNIASKNGWYYLGSGLEFWAIGSKVGSTIRVEKSRGFRQWQDKLSVGSLRQVFSPRQEVSMNGWINTELSNSAYLHVVGNVPRTNPRRRLLYAIYATKDDPRRLGLAWREDTGMMTLLYVLPDGHDILLSNSVPDNFYAQPISSNQALKMVLPDNIKEVIKTEAMEMPLDHNLRSGVRVTFEDDRSMTTEADMATEPTDLAGILKTSGLVITTEHWTDVLHTCPYQEGSQVSEVLKRDGPSRDVSKQRGSSVDMIPAAHPGTFPWVRVFTNCGLDPWSIFTADGSRVVVFPGSSFVIDPFRPISIPVLETEEDYPGNGMVMPSLIEWTLGGNLNHVVDTGMDQWISPSYGEPSFRVLSPELFDYERTGTVDIDFPSV